MERSELASLLRAPESERVERKASASSLKDIRKTLCAFANDMGGRGGAGVLFVGLNDDGSCAGIDVDDELLVRLANLRDDGAITPFPRMQVEALQSEGCDVVAITVEPAQDPPVRFKGRIWVRVGPTTVEASPEDERQLAERRRSGDQPFDIRPVDRSTLADLDVGRFRTGILPAVIPADVVEANRRSDEHQLASLRLVTTGPEPVPTALGLLVLSDDPRDWIPGAYLQFLRIDGTTLADPIKDSKDLGGPVDEVLHRIDEVLQAHVSVAVDVTSGSLERRQPDYPLAALQQLVRNAVLHRSYEGTAAPVRVSWFSDRIEIQNPGGPYGQVTVENFGRPGVTDYRNPHLAEMLKYLGFVQRFGVGLEIARAELEANGNPPPKFEPRQENVLVTVWRAER